MLRLLKIIPRFFHRTLCRFISILMGNFKFHHYHQHNFILVIIIIILFICFLSTAIYFQIIEHFKSKLLNELNNGNNIISSKSTNINKNGIHIIVGQYMGKGYPWINQINLTDDLLNVNNYSPLPNYGENGSPVYVPKMDHTQAKRLFAINQFNIVASDMISVNRSLPDIRKQACRVKKYPENLPDTSIIIVFHNEAWSTLGIRTVHSVILRSPHRLINEIILVDDASQRKFLGHELDEYMDKLSKEMKIPIKILRSMNRIGLISARIMGANFAKGQVLSFLDAHCEATNGWLEPLLHRILIDGKVAICPVIDIINDQNFAYVRSFEAHWGAMNWALNFRWFSVDYFFELGTYDSHLQVWGGENIEMSLRIWQCGGKVEIAPCSHVGHVFRSSSPYSFGKKQVGDVLYGNLIRVAEVWLDDWKNFFYNMNPTAKQILHHDRNEILKDIEKRIDLRKKLKCHSFKWFLENVWPENFFPNTNNTFGQIQSFYSKECMQRPSNGVHPIGKVIMTKCSIEIYGPQSFIVPSKGKIGFIKSDESVCIDANSKKTNTSILLIGCNQLERQKWRYDSKFKHIIHVKSSLCITIDRQKTTLLLAKCLQNNKRQAWKIISQNWNKH
ncbi:polypeptide N-acetylgalactosaminyltransferase [Dermatophagoides pteronyssinus]|uniref:Polypeptide N-acetylgalactosaminyltransferase n=1 Tax=Dermatophagoides pteronyssinus TaxID=6956 RepID=A0ABQ8IWU5_DERPT|nr:polypeptide N-acetylgalactosaminyltransferase [Dermatophagoides pteronyssinus]